MSLQTNIRGFGRQGFYGDGNTHAQMAEPLTQDQLRARCPSLFVVEAHADRSARFAPIPSINIVTALGNEGFLPFEAKQSRAKDASRIPYTKHMVRFRKSELNSGSYRSEINGDSVPEIVLMNANDGTSSYKMFGGFFRFLCFNGLIVSDGHVHEIRIPHIGDPVGKVIEGAYQVLSETTRAIEVRDAWRDIELKRDEQIAFAEAAHGLRFNVEPGQTPDGVAQAITPLKLLDVRRSGDAGNDLWKTFNVIQENCIKGGLHGVSKSHRTEEGKYIAARRVQTREVKGIDQDVKLNRALWQLGTKMAELKGVAA